MHSETKNPQGENRRQPIVEQGQIEAENIAPLPIPQVTREKRDLKYQEAARRYIHHGETNLAKLAKELNIGRSHLSTVCSEDDWDGFAARYRTLADTGGEIWSLLGRRSPESLAEIAREREIRSRRLRRARDQAEQIELRLASDGSGELPACPDPTTPEHARLIATLAKLTQLAAELSGLADLEAEDGEKRRAAIGIEAQVLKLQAQAPKLPDSGEPRKAAGTVINPFSP